MPSPVMTEQVFQSGGTAPVLGGHPGAQTAPPQYQDYPGYPTGIDEGRVMTFGGTATAAGLMMLVLLVGAWFGWQQVTETATGQFTRAGDPIVSASMAHQAWLYIALFGGFGIAIFTTFKPLLARFTSLPYAIIEGFVLGAISHLYDSQSKGIAIQAVLATAGVFLAMLVLYGLRILRATPRFTKGVIAATMGIAVMYAVGWIASLFTSSALSFFNSPSLLGIGFSLVVVVIASMNLILDFDMIEKGVNNRAPAAMEWYGAFGLTVTIVWLYLEMLRLLSKLNQR